MDGNATKQPVQGTTNTFAVVRQILKEHGFDLSPEGEAFVASNFTDAISVGGGKAFIATPCEIEPSQELWACLSGLLNKPDTRRLFVVSKEPMERTSTRPARNPFSAEHRNVTQQMLLTKSDPNLAEQLQREALSGTVRGQSTADEGNPFSRASWNLTEQMKLMRANPELAAQMERNANANA